MSEPHVSKEQKYREIISSVVLTFLKRDKACSSPEQLHDTVTNLTQVCLLFMCIGSCVLLFLLLGTLTIDNLKEINKRKFTPMTCSSLSDLPTKLYLTTELNMIQDTLPAKLHGKYQLNLHEKTSLLISTRSYGDQAIQALMNNPDLVGSYDFILVSR